MPISNPRPEAYVAANNPNSPIGQSPNPLSTLFGGAVNFGTDLGTLTMGAGVYAAFDSNVNKPMVMCAYAEPSIAGLNNYIGKVWSLDPSFFPFSWPGYALPSPYDATISGMSTAVQQLIASGFTAVAPNDRAFLGANLPVNWEFQASDATGPTVTLATGTTTGAVGETLTVTISGGTGYQSHMLVFNGDGVNSIAVAQLSINTANRGTGGIPGV